MPLKPELLLVDDDPIAIQTLSRMLTGHAQLRFARSGAEALALARKHPPDLMLLDAEMPGMSGFDVLRALKVDDELASLPVIVVTSHHEPEMEAAVFELGAVDFLSKPLVAAQVVSRVGAHLRLRRIANATKRMYASNSRTEQVSVLVVDDDVNAIQMLRITLASMVGQIKFATNGEAALRLMMEHTPDLVLLDVQMPGLDGFAVCEAMQADPVLCHVPVALITRFADAESETRGLEAGATEFIAKPYQPAVLKARIRNLLRIKQENDAALRALSEHWQRLGDARVSDIVAAASDAVMTIDAVGCIALINTSACTLFGASAESVLGREAAMVLPGAGALLEILTGFEINGSGPHLSALPTRLELQRADGATFLVEPTVSRIGDAADQITTVLLRDVTERVRAEQLERARSEAEAASRAKTMMMSYIAHEIGNPLNAILGFGQLMDMDSRDPLSPGQAHRLSNIMAAGMHVQSLMRDVMDVSKFESGNFDVNLSPVDADKAAGLALAEVAAQAELAGIRIGGQPRYGGFEVVADAGRLQQCLVNLLTNAIKYNRPGGKVELTVGQDESSTFFEVRDDGIGMTEQQCARLFEPFNRLGRAESGIRGIGLGLVVTRLLVMAMKGKLDVNSTIRSGSVFKISLPNAGGSENL
jgi:PAS domain S-box-containing protein